MQAQTILITGGAGYVGSHISWLFAKQGYQVIVLDAFLHQHNPALPWAIVIKGDSADKAILHSIFSTYAVAAVFHCAALHDVDASFKDPRLYYDTNVVRTLQLLQSMLEHRVSRIIFASSAAVYGNAQQAPLDELQLLQPQSPYASTACMVERIIADFAHAYGIAAISLRMFTAAGAQPEDNLGQLHAPQTHIVPRLLCAMMEQKPCTVFGNDYATQDGTCVRDYIHVRDVAQAYLLAYEHLIRGNPSDVFNLGTGNPVSIKQLVSTIEQLFNVQLKISWAKHHDAHPAYVVADARKAHQILGWQPRFSSLEHIIQSAYAFMCKQRNMQRLC
jgi:UDP-glucose 4-epimerase